MTPVKKKTYRILLWLIRWLRIDGKVIKEMRSVDKIKDGHIYSHYGRIIVAEKAEKACERCDLNALCLPCGNCEQSFTWTILETHSQNSTSQRLYQKITAQRLGYRS